MMRKIRTREHLSVFEAQTFELALVLVPIDSDQVNGDRLWRIPEFPGEYSTPRRAKRPDDTPMMNRGSLNECCQKLFDYSNYIIQTDFPKAKCVFGSIYQRKKMLSLT